MSIQVSVVVPLYNKETYVLNAVKSAVSQGDAVMEVLVVDDGSTDSGAERVEALNHSKVRVIRKKNGGVSSARNRGIQEARGEYITFLDADDIYLDGYIAEIVELIKDFPSTEVYATSFYKQWPNGRREPAYIPMTFDSGKAQLVQDPFTAWSRGSFIHTGSFCVRKDTLFRENIYFPLGENIGEDQDVIFRLMESTLVAFSPRPLMCYSQEIANSLYSSLPDYLLPCYARLAQRARTPNYPSQLRSGAYRMASVGYLSAVRILITKARRFDAARLIFQTPSMYHFTYWLRTLIRLCLPIRLMKLQWLKWV
ncbi:glycosyl transferase family 2 [Nitrosospira multiformis]|uniref:Glycosyl transferase family 2 n=1 Tax=Nitrosospira multiformis TaxID=1231 RepID=A0A2T5IB34_9PROT|nr:glycosyltransferase family 2 protein [Nitrosospira multiformis]PTQ81030.1 glycosyl transferase family 2 [Nitrosospira multiformis]